MSLLRLSGSVLLLLILIAPISGCVAERGEEAPPTLSGPPSIILISLDTTRADRLGSYGATSGATPNLDALGARGVVFESAVSPVPITLPAHATMLTGLYPRRHGVRDNGIYRLPSEIPTLAELLGDEGYATGAVVAAEVLDRQYGLDRGFSEYDDAVQGVGVPGGLAIPERRAEQVTDEALGMVSRLEPPFLLFVHYFDAHADYRPPSPFDTRFGDPYDGELAYMDQQIGRLLSGLEQRGILNNAAVLVVADHGESLGEHGEATHGVFLYQSTLHVPMMLLAPGRIPGGRRAAGSAGLQDVMPTLLDLGQVSAPTGLDGESLLQRARGSAVDATTRFTLLESEFGYNAYGWSPLHGLTDGSSKWILAPQPELYDLAADPSETNNLAEQRSSDADDLFRVWRERSVEDRRAPPPGDESDPDTASRLDRLSSLGYASAPGRARPDGRSLPDPKTVIGGLDRINRARELYAAGRAMEAIPILEEVTRSSPGNLSGLVLLGSCRIVAGQPSSAVGALEKAAELAPHKADVHYNLGIARMMSGDAAGAEAAWRRALSVAPRYLEAVGNLVDLLEGTNRVDEAETVLSRSRAAGLEGPVMDYLEGRIALRRSRTDAAKTAFTRALRNGLAEPLRQDAQRLLEELAR